MSCNYAGSTGRAAWLSAISRAVRSHLERYANAKREAVRSGTTRLRTYSMAKAPAIASQLAQARSRREPQVPMKKEAPAANPDAYIASLRGWRRRYAEALRGAVLDAAPVQERIKWGHLVYFSNGPAH